MNIKLFFLLLSIFYLQITTATYAQTIEYGLAQNYPYDNGIDSHNAVIFATGFEDINWQQEIDKKTNVCADVVGTQSAGSYWLGQACNYWRYKNDQPSTSYPTPYTYRINNPGLAYSGYASLENINLQGKHVPQASYIYFQKQDKVYLRWYRRYEPGFDFSCQVKTNALGGAVKSNDAGIKPTGIDEFVDYLQIWKKSNLGNGIPYFYTYHVNQPGGYGESMPQNQNGNPININDGHWHSYEIMLKLNTADSSGNNFQNNGETKLWIDGILKGSYTNLVFRTRNIVDIKQWIPDVPENKRYQKMQITHMTLSSYVGGNCTTPKDQKVWDDNLVVATQYIGPMITAPTSPLPASCPGNYNTDSQVNLSDLSVVLSQWGQYNLSDLGLVLASWNKTCP